MVWSTLEDTREALKNSTIPTLNERYKVPPFDTKAEGDHFFVESGVPTTFFITPFYWDNFIDMGMEPKKAGDGSYELILPMGNHRLAGMCAEDVGRCALNIFKHPSEYVNKRIGVRSEALTLKEMAEKMGRALNKTIRHRDITLDEYRRQTFPGAKELGNMFQYYQECENEVVRLRCADTARKLNPNLMSFDQWLAKYREHIPLRGWFRFQVQQNGVQSLFSTNW